MMQDSTPGNPAKKARKPRESMASQKERFSMMSEKLKVPAPIKRPKTKKKKTDVIKE
jgi:hypothetical protein